MLERGGVFMSVLIKGITMPGEYEIKGYYIDGENGRVTNMDRTVELGTAVDVNDEEVTCHGKWLWELADNGWADHICSVCGYTKNTDVHVHLGWSYCPKCGADMRKKSNKAKWEERVFDIDGAKHRDFMCSQCYYIHDKGSKFCPNCGADMK